MTEETKAAIIQTIVPALELTGVLLVLLNLVGWGPKLLMCDCAAPVFRRRCLKRFRRWHPKSLWLFIAGVAFAGVMVLYAMGGGEYAPVFATPAGIIAAWALHRWYKHQMFVETGA
jgi:hypothetical protein